MTLQWLLPVWAVALIFIPLAALAVYCLVRAKTTTVRLRWIRRVIMVVLLVIVAIRPTIPDPNSPSIRTNVDVFFVVDQTGSMVAEDYDGKNPRMDGVKADMRDLVAQFPGARFAIIGWGSTASRQLPLTTDTTAVGSWIDTVSQEITAFSDGSSVDRPRDLLFRTLDAQAQRSPGNVRLVYFFGDGEQTDPAEVPASYEKCAPLIDGGAVLGYGTEKGGAMRAFDPADDPNPENPEYIRDETKEGNPIAMSILDEENLKKISGQMGIDYEHRTDPSSTKDLVSSVDTKSIAEDGREVQKSFQDIYWIFAIAMLGLLLWEIWDTALRTKPRPTKEMRAERRAANKADRVENARKRAAKDAERAATREANRMAPSFGGAPPGYGGAPPGYGGRSPGQGGAPPGYGGTPPGYGGRPAGPAGSRGVHPQPGAVQPGPPLGGGPSWGGTPAPTGMPSGYGVSQAPPAPQAPPQNSSPGFAPPPSPFVQPPTGGSGRHRNPSNNGGSQ